MYVYHIPFVVRLFADLWQYNCIKVEQKTCVKDQNEEKTEQQMKEKNVIQLFE